MNSKTNLLTFKAMKKRKTIGRSFDRAKGNIRDPLTEEELDIRAEEIKGALEAGALSYTAISKHTELTIKQIQDVFEKRIECYAFYRRCIMRNKAIAADNVLSFMGDRDHPKCWEATRFFASKYKTELDDIFQRDRDDEVQVSVDLKDKQNEGNKINIIFSSQSKKANEED